MTVYSRNRTLPKLIRSIWLSYLSRTIFAPILIFHLALHIMYTIKWTAHTHTHTHINFSYLSKCNSHMNIQNKIQLIVILIRVFDILGLSNLCDLLCISEEFISWCCYVNTTWTCGLFCSFWMARNLFIIKRQFFGTLVRLKDTTPPPPQKCLITRISGN